MAVVQFPKPENDSAPHGEPDPTDADAPDAPPSGAPPQSSTLEMRWIDVGAALDLVEEAPSAQTWLLKQWHGQRDHGVFPRGRTGLLTATGGVGKTYALIQLAIAVASGGFWLETFRAVEPGHVLLALGEEDLDEARRRIWRALNASDLKPEQRREMAERLHLLPLHGVPVALTWSPANGVIVASDFAGALRDKLNGHGVDWSLVILDPLSRWAGGGIESNNEAATRFVQVIEMLTTVRGNPSVLVAHHSSQVSTQAGKSDARGVTGIRDGFRWHASMDAVADEDGTVEGVLLRNPKSNYSLRFRPLMLARNIEPGIEGTLRLATDVETEQLRATLPKDRRTPEQREEEKRAKTKSTHDSRRGLVLELLPSAPACVSRDQLQAALLARGESWSLETIRTVVCGLIDDGAAVDLSDGRRATPRQWARSVTRDS